MIYLAIIDSTDVRPRTQHDEGLSRGLVDFVVPEYLAVGGGPSIVLDLDDCSFFVRWSLGVEARAHSRTCS